ncbi:YfbU family protein [Halobacillus sp. GSS1]|uniref:YfbU family protein n=1 Tax=Halobacillus sp. GSS1 TaxID=2815919 RepID=UPI001A8D09B3|nr:YfbU family protein [Halobacillus sp. GSS1]MBN9654708.1 YfbU family protein [Halobacillus sp. GSS1]
MSLSNSERLILLNQYSILEKLDPDYEAYYGLKKEIVENGYVQDYGELYQTLAEEVEEITTKEVWDILQMYRSITFSYDKLKDKEGLEKTDIKFRGFDGNNETTHMFYTKFVLHKLDRYKELWDDEKYPDYNTHSPRLEKYRRMLKVWKLESDRYDSHLSAQEIKTILNA